MNVQKIHSVTKKITVALLGGFLLIFVLFHACANLCVLRNDDGAWYSAFCHFMGTNYVVKVFEIVLMLTILCHIIITLWLAYTNYKARGTVRYHHASKTKTHTGSKLMAWTGALILCFLVVHFFHFYFVKMDLVPGTYMVEAEELAEQKVSPTVAKALQCGPVSVLDITDEIIETFEYCDEMEKSLAGDTTGQMVQFQAWRQGFEQLIASDAMLSLAVDVKKNNMLTEDGKWIKNIDKEQKAAFEEAGFDVEPDFYTMVRAEFKNPVMAILYLIFFVVLWFHMRHAFPSAFQTLGLNNYTYNKALDIAGNAYAWIVCLMFAATVIGVWFLV